jgi:hypothetical protein
MCSFHFRTRAPALSNALHVRYAPYQALVRCNNTLVYVPLDSSAYIRPYYSDVQAELTQDPPPCAACSGATAPPSK